MFVSCFNTEHNSSLNSLFLQLFPKCFNRSCAVNILNPFQLELSITHWDICQKIRS